MGSLIILEFDQESVAKACLRAINHIAAAYWLEQGYTVLTVDGEKQLVGKNAATGLDDLSSARTITWDTIRQSPEGTWYFSSLTGDARFYQGMEQLYAFDFVEKYLPEVWLEDTVQD